MKNFKFLKQIDAFPQPIQTFVTSRNKKTNQKTFAADHGSILGGSLSLICYMVTFIYISNELIKMIQGQMDTYSQMIYQNDGNNPEFNQDFIGNNSFFPFFSIMQTQKNQFYKSHGIDIWDNSLSGGGKQNQVFDIKKLKRFIDVQITIRYMFSNGTDNRYSIPFRNCNDEDFHRRKFKHISQNVQGHLLCPDIDNFNEILQIENFYDS